MNRSNAAMAKEDVLIVGGGLAGLCCAIRLQRAGVPFQLFEASDAVGGRVRTDLVDGFRLDRGFQVFLDSYPEARELLDYSALKLRPFLPGALVRFNGRFHTLADPWRRPGKAVRSVFSPIGTLSDKLRIASFRSSTLRGSLDDLFATPETTSLEALQRHGFSTSIIERFFRPFLGGIFLDPELLTSSRMLRFVFRMFSLGSATLPSDGMEAIPRQLAAKLPAENIHLKSRVARVEARAVTLESGERIDGRQVVLAVEGNMVRELLGGTTATTTGIATHAEMASISEAGQAVTCLYFAAPSAPVTEPVLILNGDGEGPVNNVCFPTVVAPSYGPPGKTLVSVTVLGMASDPHRLLSDVRRQLEQWFGSDASAWSVLRVYTIPFALPRQFPPSLATPRRDVRLASGLLVCGDHRDNASINGAMVSGRRAAEAILEARP
jgi:phytoene dehydrogenase-like protein